MGPRTLLYSETHPHHHLTMGRVRTKTVKKAARLIIEKYYPRLTLDFQTNKKICEEVAIIPSKRLRNKIAGYVTHLMKRIERGPVKGISIKLQEMERERRDNYVPEVSAIETEHIQIDSETQAMLQAINPDFASLSCLEVVQVSTFGPENRYGLYELNVSRNTFTEFP